MRGTVEDRFWTKVDFAGPNGCWLWTAAKSKDGYGRFHAAGPVRAHRWAYEHTVGIIPPGLQLDHLCRVRHCVNPDHLDVVTCRTNVLRSNAPAARNAVKTHCLHGHEFTPDNTMRGHRGRECRECRRRQSRAYKQRQREARRAAA